MKVGDYVQYIATDLFTRRRSPKIGRIANILERSIADSGKYNFVAFETYGYVPTKGFVYCDFAVQELIDLESKTKETDPIMRILQHSAIHKIISPEEFAWQILICD